MNITKDKTKLDDIKGWQRFTDNAKQIIINAHELAQKYRNPYVTPIHVFQVIIQEPSNLLSRVFEQVGLDIENTRAEILSEIERRAKTGITSPKFSDELKRLINDSFLVAEKLSHVYVGSEHLLVAMLETGEEDFVHELRQLGLSASKVSQVAMSLGTYPAGVLSQTTPDALEDGKAALPYFAHDMNEQALQNEFLNITGRDEEIERLIHILARKTKNNPILVGDAGVGKTAVVQGLVQRIIREEVPPSFIGKQVISLDISGIIAGAKVRGDVEERILGFVNETIEAGDRIVFIDEIHMIVGAGSAGGRDAMDIGNILKPYLMDTNLRVIGATTVDEYRRYFDDEPALSRRFQPIEIEEIDRDSAVDILMNLKQDFEEFHGVKIKDEAVIESVDLSAKFISDRYLPDKAIDLLDEAAASVKIGREIQIEPALSDLGEKLLNAQRRKEDAMQNHDLKLASKHKVAEEKITGEITSLIEGKHFLAPKAKVVDANLIRKIVVDWTKIPLAAGDIGDDRLHNLYNRFRQNIVGEDHVLKSVVDAIKRSHLGLTSHNRPLASFLFLGPTGVGKTELAKTIARDVFGSDDLLMQYNMSEFMEMHSVAKLIGSPPGYVGYQEGGQLTEQIRRRPYSVVLFDEIEKAHPEVLNLLLQILEEGELSDGRGRKAKFQNTIVILTSNIGAEDVSRDNRLGFNVDVEKIEDGELDKAFQSMRDNLLEILKQEVRPELLNRLDSIEIFRGLNEKDCLQITKLQLHALSLRLIESGILLEFNPAVAKLINKEGYSQEYGARNIRRKIQELIENGLANYLMEHKLTRPKKQILKLEAKVANDKLVFTRI